MTKKSKIFALFDDPSFVANLTENTIEQDAGIVENVYGYDCELLNHLTLFYNNFVEVYLSRGNDIEEKEDILVKGIGRTLKDAQQDAINKFNAEAYGNVKWIINYQSKESVNFNFISVDSDSNWN